MSCADIAGRLGVSERTVKRDMAEIRPYCERKVRGYLRKPEEARVAKVDAELEGKSLGERLKILERTWVDYMKLVKRRKYLRRQLTVTIDLDRGCGCSSFDVYSFAARFDKARDELSI